MTHLAPLAGRPAPIATVAQRLVIWAGLVGFCALSWAGIIALVAR